MKLNNEVKKKVIEFLMDGKDEMCVGSGYSFEEKVYSKEEVKKEVNECKDFSELESLLMREYDLECMMSFGDVLDELD